MKWRKKLLYLKKKYPVSKEYVNKSKNYVSSFKFVDDLCKYLRDDDVVVTDMGTSFTCTMQAFQAKNKFEKTKGPSRTYPPTRHKPHHSTDIEYKVRK